MAYIKNNDPNDGERMIPDVGVTIATGEWAEVPDALAAKLAEQSIWQLVDEHGKKLPEPEPQDEIQGETEGDTEPHAEVSDAPEKHHKSKSKAKAEEAE